MAALAHAQGNPYGRDIDLVVVKPTPTLNSGISLEGADTMEKRSYQLEFLLDANVGLLALNSGNQRLGDLIPFRLDGHVMGAYQLLSRLELSLDLPVTLYQSTNFGILTAQGIPMSGVSAAGLGDLRLLPRVTLLHPKGAPLGVAVVLETRLPTGNGQAFLGGGSVVFAPRAALERAFGPVRMLLNLGARIRGDEQFLNLHVDNELTAGVGAIVTLPDIWRLRHVQVMGETNLATPAANPFTFSKSTYDKSPWDLLFGARATVHGPWGVELDVGRGLTGEAGYGREGFRVMAALRYQFDASQYPKDSDHDGIPDSEDACPDQPGPAEYDGCPDTDGDQIPDNVDKCPTEPGPPDNEGCPVKELVTLQSNRIQLKGTVLFDTNQATIQSQSFPLLNEVYTILSHHPELGVVRVDGHTDNRGSRPFNQDLSERRAKAVLEYLVNKGLPKARLRYKGFGLDKPIATNDTPLGRAKNRRVEFAVVGKEPQQGLKEPEKASKEPERPAKEPAKATKEPEQQPPAGAAKPAKAESPPAAAPSAPRR
jgi:outer membrane protein OmpA-like peptidoglycan-associated protein